MSTNNATNTGILAVTADVKAGTSSRLVVNPASLQGYMADLLQTGFESWAAGGPYWSVAGTTLTLLAGGTGYIQGKLITWAGSQNTGALAAGATYYVYIDNTGTIGTTSSRTDALFQNDIVLFEVFVDSTPVTPVVTVVKENHPYSFPTTDSNYQHAIINAVIANYNNGANIALNGSDSLQINGDDKFEDHGLSTAIPDSASSAVTWNFCYTNAGGKWIVSSSGTTFPATYNNAGTLTALVSGHAVFRLYVSKDNLNTTTPTYYAIYDTSKYTTQTLANNAITAGTPAAPTNELLQIELAQLGFITVKQSTTSITSVVIQKSTARAQTTTSGTNQASLVTTSTGTFTGWLGATDTTVQQALNDLDQVLIGGTAGQVALSQGAGAQPVYKTPSATVGGNLAVTTNATTLSYGISAPVTIANGGTNAVSMTNTDGVCYFDGSAINTTAVGSINQILTSNGAGVAPTFQNFTAAALKVNIQEFHANGTYTPTSGMQYCIVEVVGGGGAGGGASATTGSQYSIGGGGGAGGYSCGFFSAATIGASQSVTVPAAATGVSGGTGNTGGTCSLGALIQATGGSGGVSALSAPLTGFAAGGGNAGVGSGGTINIYGNPGGEAYFFLNAWSVSGIGGNSNLGGGAQANFGASGVGNNASGYGGGGGGAYNGTSQAARVGGSGGVGEVKITEYILSSTQLTYPITVPNGGTGLTSITADGVLYGNGTAACGVTAVGTAKYPLTSNGAGNAPTFQQTDLTAGVTGILPIANGGTDASSFSTSNGVVKFDGTRLVSSSAATYNASNVFNNTAQPAFSAYLSSAKTNVSGNSAAYNFVCDTVVFDQASNYNNTTGKFTAPVAGKYFFYANAYVTNNTASNQFVILLLSGTVTTLAYNITQRPGTVWSWSLGVSGFVTLAANATVFPQICINGEAGNTDTLYGAAFPLTVFGGYLVC